MAHGSHKINVFGINYFITPWARGCGIMVYEWRTNNREWVAQFTIPFLVIIISTAMAGDGYKLQLARPTWHNVSSKESVTYSNHAVDGVCVCVFMEAKGTWVPSAVRDQVCLSSLMILLHSLYIYMYIHQETHRNKHRLRHSNMNM